MYIPSLHIYLIQCRSILHARYTVTFTVRHSLWLYLIMWAVILTRLLKFSGMRCDDLENTFSEHMFTTTLVQIPFSSLSFKCLRPWLTAMSLRLSFRFGHLSAFYTTLCSISGRRAWLHLFCLFTSLVVMELATRI